MESALSRAGVVWVLLSLGAVALSCVGLYAPYWLEGTLQVNATPTALGLFRRCHYLRLGGPDGEQGGVQGGMQGGEQGGVQVVRECGRYASFAAIPCVWWQAATVCVGLGSAVLLLVAVAGVLSCCCVDILTRTTARLACVLQLAAGLCVGCGCALYPLGWDIHDVTQACGNASSVYNPGSCRMSWAFYCTIAGSFCAFLCALLTCHSVRNKGYHRSR